MATFRLQNHQDTYMGPPFATRKAAWDWYDENTVLFPWGAKCVEVG